MAISDEDVAYERAASAQRLRASLGSIMAKTRIGIAALTGINRRVLHETEITAMGRICDILGKLSETLK